MSIKYYVLVVLGISPQGFLDDLHSYILAPACSIPEAFMPLK